MIIGCKQITKQSKGQITEIKLDRNLLCYMAWHCRRKGICSLSPYSRSGVHEREEQPESGSQPEPADNKAYPPYYEVLQFKNSLGFQWVQVETFAEAVRFLKKRNQKGQPRLIRRVELFKLPE